MPIKITNRTVPVHQHFYDSMPRWKLEAAEYEKAKITSVDEKPESMFGQQDKQRIIKMSSDIGEPLTHWPRIPITDEIKYYEFLNKTVDPKTNKFYPTRDEERPFRNHSTSKKVIER